MHRSWPDLVTAIGGALASGRIGTPVSVRLTMEEPLGPHEAEQVPAADRVVAALAALLAQCESWLSSPVVNLQALPAGRHYTVLARFLGGGSALVGWGTTQEHPLLEAALFGNHGVLSWQPDGADFLLASQPAAGSLPAPPVRLAQAVELSLQEKSAVAVKPDSVAAAAEVTPAVPAGPGPAPQKPATLKAQSGPLGVLLVTGSHTHQENYALELAADPRCHLVGVTDAADVSPRRQALNAALAQRLGIPYLEDFATALARPDVHIVSICAEPDRRGPLIVQAAAAGKHLYLDKPLAATVEEADAATKAIHDAGVVSHMFSQVHWPWALRAREIVASGQLGDLKAVHFDLLFAKGQTGTAHLYGIRPERARPTNFEGIESKRELTNVGVYPLALLPLLTDRPVRSVFAATGNYFFAEHQQHDMEDFGQMLLELDGGVVASVTAGRTGWQSHPQHGLNRICLVGSARSVCLDTSRPRVEIWSDGPAWSPPSIHPEDPMGFWKSTNEESGVRPKQDWFLAGQTPPKSDAVHFIDCVTEGRAADVDISVAALTAELLTAAYESASKQTNVQLPLQRSNVC